MFGKLGPVIKNVLKSNEKMDSTQEIRVDTFHVRTEIKSRFATTVVKSCMTNLSKKSKEVSFTSRLPEQAFITDFCMQIGDKIVHGEVKEKQAAKRTYDEAKSRGQSAGHVFQKSRETDVFTTSTNVGANTQVTFTLTYQEILQRVHGVYKHVINMDLDQIQSSTEVKIDVEIMERGRINKVHVPKFGPKMGEKTNTELLKLEADPTAVITTKMDDSTSISTSHITYHMSAQEMTSREHVGGQFVVLYDLDRDTTGGQVQVVNGYFVHFIAPEGLDVGGKHVVFVLDKSGSMGGRKLDQTKHAMRRVLGDLHKNDTFNIIWFSDNSHLWKPKSVPATFDNIMQAISDVEKTRDQASTNIHDAIMDGIDLLSKSESNPLASMIVFMTDGQANSGAIHQASALVDAITNRNKEKKFIIHTLAFGRDADYDMLQKISARNNGLACKIYEDLDADVQLIGFYQQISSPLLADVQINYTKGPVDLNSLVHDHTSTYYSGSEMIVLGRLNNLSLGDDTTDNTPLIEAEISGRGSNGFTRLMSKCCFPFPCPSTRPNPNVSEKRLTTKSDTDAGDFIERMWAYQTIKKLLKESQLGFWSNVEKEDKRKQALDLSLKYRFVTELTSMVVVEDDLKKMDELNNAAPERQQYLGGGLIQKKSSTSAGFFAMPMVKNHAYSYDSCDSAIATDSLPSSAFASNFCATSTSTLAYAPAQSGAVAFGSVCSAPRSLFGGAAPVGGGPPVAMQGGGGPGMFGSRYAAPMGFGACQAVSNSGVGQQSDDEEAEECLNASKSRSPSPPPKPISYTIIILDRSNKSNDKSIEDAIEQWKTAIATFFERLFWSNPKQPYVIHLISLNSIDGFACEIAKIHTDANNPAATVPPILKGALLEAFYKERKSGDYQPMEDLVKRDEDVQMKKQIWINLEQANLLAGPLSDVFYYLNKIAGYDYMSQDDLNGK